MRPSPLANFLVRNLDGMQGRSKVVAAFGRKPLNFRITSGLEVTLEQPWMGWRILTLFLRTERRGHTRPRVC
jgi:hypothetical protein